MTIPAELRRQVIQRANGCCEYCLMSQVYSFLDFEIDHIRAEKHRGSTTPDNLCYSCFDCNRHKGSDLASYDPLTDDLTRLYHPRNDDWDVHFRLNGVMIVPLTAIGRVTVFLLQLNSHEQQVRRSELLDIGEYPCRLMSQLNGH